MIVVADATPLHYLVLIDETDLLQKLFASVVVPPAVIDELSHPSTPQLVRAWIAHPPHWLIQAAAPRSKDMLPFPELGLGERQAIWLGQSEAQSILLTDDQDARLSAEKAHIRVLPTLRLLSIGQELGLVDLERALKRLTKTNFRVSNKVMARLLSEER